MSNPMLRDWNNAFLWICQRRQHAPPSADIWHLRYHWTSLNSALFHTVTSGKYRLSPMLVHRNLGRSWVQWCASDALVLKWVTLQIAALLPVHPRCAHIKGHGGGKTSISVVWEQLQSTEYRFVYRTDIRGYYQHIQKPQVLSLIHRWVKEPILIDLVKQYLYYTVEDCGEFHSPEKGICRGCALSPLIGGSLLHHVDSFFSSQNELFYSRYMDDFLFLTRKRWPLKHAMKQLYVFFDMGGFERHPDKTRIGKIEQGFDWLGVWFTPTETTIAPRALNNHTERCRQVYKRARLTGASHEEASQRVSEYKHRWGIWAASMLPS